jgi:diguanylate cyclase (GGDEF)-like protein
MMTYLSASLVLMGLMIHVATLSPLRTLIAKLPAGTLRNAWLVMTGLIVVFIVGYLGYLLTLWGQPSAWGQLIIPFVFLFGALFVRLTIVLALQTAADLQRIVLLESENITDPLTQVYNRRYLDRRLDEEVARTQRYGLDLSVLMLDIDHFKRVNDDYGHQAGDVTLCALSHLLEMSLRNLDVVARYGGEEFIVICTNTALPGAALVAERLRKLVESNPIHISTEMGKSQTIAITISIGVATLSGDMTSKAKLIESADQALYRAKELGRNQVVIAADQIT